MIYNSKDDLWYATAAEFASDTEVVKNKTAKMYVYETGKIYVSDGIEWRILGKAD